MPSYLPALFCFLGGKTTSLMDLLGPYYLKKGKFTGFAALCRNSFLQAPKCNDGSESLW